MLVVYFTMKYSNLKDVSNSNPVDLNWNPERRTLTSQLR